MIGTGIEKINKYFYFEKISKKITFIGCILSYIALVTLFKGGVVAPLSKLIGVTYKPLISFIGSSIPSNKYL